MSTPFLFLKKFFGFRKCQIFDFRNFLDVFFGVGIKIHGGKTKGCELFGAFCDLEILRGVTAPGSSLEYPRRYAHTPAKPRQRPHFSPGSAQNLTVADTWLNITICYQEKGRFPLTFPRLSGNILLLVGPKLFE